jgi:hypothetical protein
MANQNIFSLLENLSPIQSEHSSIDDPINSSPQTLRSRFLTPHPIHLGATDDQAAKLSKLLSLWESKANFFDACVISKLRSPPSSMQEYHTSLLTQHAAVITPLTQTTKATFEK